MTMVVKVRLSISVRSAQSGITEVWDLTVLCGALCAAGWVAHPPPLATRWQ